MKQILSQHIAVIGQDLVVEHPTMIFTNDNVDVQVFENHDQLNYYISQQSPTNFTPLPNEGEWCELNQCYQYGELIAKCVQSHNRMNYPHEQTPALFLIITPTGNDYPVWVQPTGAHDAYQMGDRVHFPLIDSPVYESKINANVWSPTAYPAGWLLIP